MNPTLRAYLQDHFIQHPAAAMPVKDLLDRFRDDLPAKDRASWPRGRVLTELARGGFVVGTIDRVAHIAGITPRGEKWREVNGKLELANA